MVTDKVLVINRLEIRNASVVHESPYLAVGVYSHGGALKLALPEIPLKGGDDKELMHFEIGAKAKVQKCMHASLEDLARDNSWIHTHTYACIEGHS